MPAPRKDPPWITLVQTEPKKKPAPLPPSSGPGPLSQACRQVENGGLEERTQKSPEAEPEPKPYNPFEEEEEEESAPAGPSPAPAPAEATPKSLHPWYGITPTSSPKTKKRPAPRAPSASPLGKCRELPYLCVHAGCRPPDEQAGSGRATLPHHREGSALKYWRQNLNPSFNANSMGESGRCMAWP